MFGLCLLGLGSLRAGMTCYINRAEPKKKKKKPKKLHWEKIILYQHEGIKRHKLILGQIWSKQEGAGKGPFISSVQDSTDKWSPYNRSWSRKHWQLDVGEDLSYGLKDKVAPSGCLWGTHESSFQENGHFKHLPSPVSDSSKSQGSNQERLYVLP